MKIKWKKRISVILCLILLFGGFTVPEHTHEEHTHEEHDHESPETVLIADAQDSAADVSEDRTVGLGYGFFAIPSHAAYEDGVECDHCGSWRYDDWKCDNGDHCGEGSGTSCYEEHHCGYCGACDDDHELCDDCGNCLEDHCECDEKCRGCYETSGDVCSECNEKCTECAEWICDDCGKCADCAGDEAYCSICDICLNCAEAICYCGGGCARCAELCEECNEKCSNCAEEELCPECGTCYSCVGGEGNYCEDCALCKNCVDMLCVCGNCSSCATVCPECGEVCSECADEDICGGCNVCKNCVGGEGNFCENCETCKNCAEYVCYCGGGCSECTVVCQSCAEKCESCADDQLCSGCSTCWDCVGGEGNYCEECGVCKNCVDTVCICGHGCSDCAIICPECGEKCEGCADDQLCSECGICWDCIGGEGNYCEECGVCKNCVDTVCICGHGCSNCATLCPECGEKCEGCSDDQLCSECGICWDCIGGEGNYCEECGVCKDCVDIVCVCGHGCSDCATVCPDCGEKCTNCSDEEICGGCNRCKDCVGGDGDFCDNCETCKFCSEYVCVCGGGCSECATVCPECNDHCSECSDGEICVDCGFCSSCVGAENFCSECALCITCVDMVCSCGNGCANCAVVCMECCEACSNCSDEICLECGTCQSCADSEGFCLSCLLCGACAAVCPCGEGCENCADLCPECGEVCSSCSDEFCASCDLCRECADSLWCEDCGLCGECTEVCEDCGLVCRDCAEYVCEDCGKCSGCTDTFCSECGTCADCANAMCGECFLCDACAEMLCEKCGAYCSDCAAICSDCGTCEFCETRCPDCDRCENCCAEVSESFGCTHRICSESAEWGQHYCEVGEHCIGQSSRIEYDENGHWLLCGDGCDVKLNEEPHRFGVGRTTKEATAKSEGILSLPCAECDFVREEVVPKLTASHEHSYAVTVTEPTCISDGFTTHTCACGYTWIDQIVPATDHTYQNLYSEDGHWQSCAICSVTTEKVLHKMGEWTVVRKAGYTFTGVRQRACKGCDYTVQEELPMMPIPENKVVITVPSFVSDAPVSSATDVTAPLESAVPSEPTVKELLTKGSEQSVPALPTLPSTENGNVFDGWVDKETGSPVKKGDKVEKNTELVPVWKDCGVDLHTDANNDGVCEVCGYTKQIETVQKEPEQTEIHPEHDLQQKPSAPDEVLHADSEDTASILSGIPMWVMFSIGGFAVVVIGCIIILLATGKKK